MTVNLSRRFRAQVSRNGFLKILKILVNWGH
jgi:hypothetical protein